jgi:hypothetical protein
MVDCLSCDNYTKCDLDKVALYVGKGCGDYKPMFKSHKKRVCKYCGETFSTNRGDARDVCNTCVSKTAVLPRFAKARDDLRELCGLERMNKNG